MSDEYRYMTPHWVYDWDRGWIWHNPDEAPPTPSPARTENYKPKWTRESSEVLKALHGLETNNE